MNRHCIIPATSNLVSEVVSRLQGTGNDYSDSLIVFPGKRPAHFVRKALAERVKGSFIPPRIFSIDSFIEFLATEQCHVSARPLDTFDAVALLFDIHTKLGDPLGGDHFKTVDRFIGVGLRLFAELEELVMAGVSERQIRDAMGSVPLGRIHVLPDYFAKFYTSVAANGYTTRSLSYKTVAEQIEGIDLSGYRNLVLAGFYAYTALEQRIVKSLLRRDNTTFIAQQGPGLRKHLLSVGVDEQAQVQSPPSDDTPACSFTKATDTHGQVFAVSQQIKSMLDKGEPINERTAIVLPTADALFPVVHQTLALLQPDQYNIALGYPLRRTPLYGFLSNLMDLAGGARNGDVPASSYTAFVLHPYTKNIRLGQRSDVTRVLFHALEMHLAQHQSRMFLSLESLEEDTVFFDTVARSLASAGIDVSVSHLKEHLREIHNHTVTRFLHLESLGDFAARAIEVLQYIYKSSTATRHQFFHPYAQRFIELFDSIAHSLLASHRFEEPEAYFTFLRNAVASEEIPFSGTPVAGLQVLGLLETRNLTFDRVFLLNATDNVLPGTGGNDVLLPQPLREHLGLDTYRERERLAEYYFSILLGGAHEVHCFFSESGNQEKSRFLEKLLWQEQKKRNTLDVADLVRVIRYDVRLSTPRPKAIEKLPAILDHLQTFEYTATSLDTYLRCQLRFYYAHVLKLAEKEEVADDVDQAEIGRFVHEVLTQFFQPLVGKVMTPAHLDANKLRSLVDSFFAERYGTNLIGSSYLVKHQLQRQLGAFVRQYQHPKLEEGAVTLLALEQSFSVRSGKYHFTGRIDRIEQRGNRHVILDYKTGRDDSHVKINLGKLTLDDPERWRNAIGSFQLPMYMLLYSEAQRVPINSISPAYLFLGRNEISPDIEVGLGGKHNSAEEVFHAVQPVMRRLVEEIVDPARQFTPTSQFSQDCPRCPYRVLCGTSWAGQ